jgi:hypothetical protein
MGCGCMIMGQSMGYNWDKEEYVFLGIAL